MHLSQLRAWISTALAAALLTVLMAACKPDTPNPAPSATQPAAPAVTPSPTLPAWQSNERALAAALLPFAFDAVCEWQPLARDGDTVYLWAACSERGGQGSAISVPVHAHLSGGLLSGIEFPQDDLCRRSKELFPPAVHSLLASSQAADSLLEAAKTRTDPSQPPAAASLTAADWAALTLPQPTPLPTHAAAPVRRWPGYSLLVAYAGSDDRLYVMEDFGPPLMIGEWDSCAGSAPELAWSPDGRTLAYPWIDPNGAYYLALYDRRQQVTQYRPTGTTGSKLAWSPDGRWIGWIEGPESQSVLRLFAAGGVEEQVIQPAVRFWWLKNGREIVYETRLQGGTLIRTDLAGQRVEQVAIPRLQMTGAELVGVLNHTEAALVWLPVARSGRSELWRASLDGARETLLLQTPGLPGLARLQPSPYESFIFIKACFEPSDDESCIYQQVRMGTRAVENVPRSHVLSWTPDGFNLVGLDMDETSGQLWLVVDRILTRERVYRAALPVPPEAVQAVGIGWGNK